MQNTWRTCRLGGESVFNSREMRRRSFASKGSRAGEAERTSYEVAKGPKAPRSRRPRSFWAGYFLNAERTETKYI